ncbi:MAG: glycosyltransferase family 2 protein [Acidobacteriia bacterium]|nr:glycosyltransferase family 2 protein [Terriglobia bacterium]
MPTREVMNTLIGIVSYNHRRFLAQCLESVSASNKHNSLRVVLVDNCSSDGSAGFVRDQYPWVEVVERERSYSFAANNNIAFARHASEYFLMLNPDTVLGEGAVDTLVKFMEDHPRCGACGPRLVFPNGSLQHSCRRFPTVWSTLLRRSPIRLLLPGDRRGGRHLMVSVSHDHEMQVDWMLGACILVRRGAIEGTKLLDEGFPLYCEDIDLCLRLKKRGWTIYYVPNATVVHHHLAKSDSRLFCRESLLHAKSMLHFLRKHYGIRHAGDDLSPGISVSHT